MQEPDHSVLHSMLNTIEQIVKLLAPDLMSLQQIQQAFDRWKVVLSDSSKRRRERAERQQQEDWDQEEEEAVQVGSPYPLGSGRASAAAVGRCLTMRRLCSGLGRCPHLWVLGGGVPAADNGGSLTMRRALQRLRLSSPKPLVWQRRSQPAS